jgi:thiamine biosynthesis protein ThiS
MSDFEDTIALDRSGETDNAAAIVLVNDEEVAWQPELTVAQVLRDRTTESSTVATAVNGVFVPRRMRFRTPLHPGDVLLVLGAGVDQ